MMEPALVTRFVSQSSVLTHYFGSWHAAVDHFAAVGSQGGGDGQQSSLNEHNLSKKVGMSALPVEKKE